MHYFYLTHPTHWITTTLMARHFRQMSVFRQKDGRIRYLPSLTRWPAEKIICHLLAMKGFVSDRRQIKRTGDLMLHLLGKMEMVLLSEIITGALTSTSALMIVLWGHARYAQLAGRDYLMIHRGSPIHC
ncbi:hypothetical protein F869_03479 [Klebsiella pneumoniae subsp. pneumoniae CIP 52.145 = B5055]|nr:hypothetical protein F869_03479 [Klebsiella pneumoniae subsp. pneumoniae CIP 52.145 = B5055]